MVDKFGGVFTADMRSGKAAAPHCKAAPARQCPLCKHIAVVPLSDAMARQQPDGTTLVCHPVLGGCNHGFQLVPQVYTFEVL